MNHDDESFESLPAAEHLLLWAMRVWVIGHCRQQDVSERIETALRKRNAQGALGYLEGFMVALSRGAARPIALLCLCRTEVSVDERQMLDAFSLLQRDEADEAEALLCNFLTQHAAKIAIRSAEGMAQEFVEAGLLLSPGVMFERRQPIESPRVLH